MGEIAPEFMSNLAELFVQNRRHNRLRQEFCDRGTVKDDMKTGCEPEMILYKQALHIIFSRHRKGIFHLSCLIKGSLSDSRKRGSRHRCVPLMQGGAVEQKKP
jgi:hypothetical protein